MNSTREADHELVGSTHSGLSAEPDTLEREFQSSLASVRVDYLAERVTELWEAPLDDISEPVVLGRFQLHYVLGRGSYGVVFSAHDREIGRDVALKVFGAEAKHAALREAQVMARVQHPNVIALHDVGQANGFHYLVLPLIDGWTMSQRVRMGLDWREAAELFIQVGRGLAAVHRAGIVHGDVKPGNMLVGRDGRAYLTDFGFAQSLVPGGPMIIGGTREYMAPECRSGTEVSPLSDQFSFCAGLWEALYGRPPDGSEFELPVYGDIPASIGHVLRRGLSTPPRDRYPDMAELIHALVVAAQQGVP